MTSDFKEDKNPNQVKKLIQELEKKGMKYDEKVSKMEKVSNMNEKVRKGGGEKQEFEKKAIRNTGNENLNESNI